MQQIPEDVKAAFDQKLAYLKSFKPELEPKGEISRDERGIWRCTYKSQWAEEGVLICMYPDGRCFETHGTIGTKWMYEVGSWIGLPVSDEESDGPDHQVSHFEHGDIRWSRSADKCEVIPKDKLSWYNYRHTELLGYLQQAVAISQPQRHEEALKAVQKKCIEDQFDVVLLGEFQHGKSTTLDVLCGGRELSPQGDGLKSTSAVPVSIEAARPELAPEGMSEWAELRFKTESELKDELFEAYETYLSDPEANVADPLKEFIVGDGNGTPKEKFRERFDWKNAEHVGRVRMILQQEWAEYAKDKGLMATRHRQQLETLTIYLKYYGTPEYRTLVEKTIVPVSAVGLYVYFPKGWKEERAPDRLDFDLTFQECAFAFLDYAVIHINSDILSQLNCRVTDCPGLGASAYDTAIARRALSRADGVWFVKKCDQQLGESTLGQIFEYIKDNGRLERTGMALNLWKSYKKSFDSDPKTGGSLVGCCKSQLAKAGYKFPIFWCNARFAYLSALGKRKIESSCAFSPAEREWMWRIDEDRIDSSLNDEDLWLQAVKEANHIPCVNEIDGIKEFGLEAVELLWKHSNFADALEVMAKIVLEQKGHAILIENGSKKAFDVLARYEHELQLAEDAASRDADKVANDLKCARQRMADFMQKAKDEEDKSRLWNSREDVMKGLSSEFVMFVLNDDFCNVFAERCAEAIHDLNRSVHWKESGFKRAFHDAIRPRLHDILAERYGDFLNSLWTPDSSKASVRKFFDDVEKLNGELTVLVDALVKKDGDLFKNLPSPKVGKLPISEAGISIILNGLNPVCEELRQGFWRDLAELLKRVFSLGASLLFKKSREEIVAETKPKIKLAVDRLLDRRSTVESFESAVKPMFERAINNVVKQIEEGVTHFHDLFEARCRGIEADSAESDERKRQIAAANNKIRTETVKPLREKLEVFEKAVEGELKR